MTERDPLISKSQAIEALEKRRDRVPADLKNYAMNEAIRIIAALPAIPPPALTESFLNELIDADETRQQGDIHEVELVFDALIRFRDAILNSGALPVLETKKEES
jgi:hypothetical protein